MNDTHAQNLMSMSRARVVAPNDRYQSVRLLQHSIRYGDSVFVDKWLFRTESYGGTVEVYWIARPSTMSAFDAYNNRVLQIWTGSQWLSTGVYDEPSSGPMSVY